MKPYPAFAAHYGSFGELVRDKKPTREEAVAVERKPQIHSSSLEGVQKVTPHPAVTLEYFTKRADYYVLEPALPYDRAIGKRGQSCKALIYEKSYILLTAYTICHI